MNIETQLRELADLCRRAGEYTAWLAPKIEAVIANMAHEHTGQVAEAQNVAAHIERDDVLAYLKEDLRRHEHAARTTNADDEERLARLRSKAGLLRTTISYIERGDHVGAAAHKEAP